MTIRFLMTISVAMSLGVTAWAEPNGTTTLSSPTVAAGEKNPYQPAGGPADPRVSVRWNRYYDYGEVTGLLKAMAAAHPGRARLQSLGQSYGHREMWVLTITSFDKGDDRSKPAFWIDGGIHANEIQATEVSLYTAWYLLEMYGRAPLVTRLVDERTWYILPMMSPDSRDAHMRRPNSTDTPRDGQRPVADRRGEPIGKRLGRDLDGDGHITQMRVRDPNGRFKPHPEYPDLMIPARPDERGQYRLLGDEGDADPEDEPAGFDDLFRYDPNRDWGWNWQPRYVQHGAYRYPFSILENRMAADFITGHPNIAGAQSYHNCGGMILRGPGRKEDFCNPADVAVFDAVAKKGELVLPGYRYITIGRDLYEIAGGEVDWLYQMRGVFTFTNELFTPASYFRRPPASGRFGEEDDQQAFNKYLLLGDGLVPWHPFDHPRLGKIEIGGMKKNWGRQPPSFLLEEECHRNMAFTLYHADQMPKVEVQSLQSKLLANGLIEVTATIANLRITPTRSGVDVAHRITPPDLVNIQGPGLRVLLGLWSGDRYFVKTTEQKRHPEAMRVTSVPGMGAVYVRWLVEGKGPYMVAVRSEKGGADRREGRLSPD